MQIAVEAIDTNKTNIVVNVMAPEVGADGAVGAVGAVGRVPDGVEGLGISALVGTGL